MWVNLLAEFNTPTIMAINLRRFLVTLCCLICLPLANAANKKGDIITKENWVVTDGDTIKSDNVRIRFYGIEAPEIKQHCFTGETVTFLCGQKSAEHLKNLVMGKEISCEVKDVDRSL